VTMCRMQDYSETLYPQLMIFSKTGGLRGLMDENEPLDYRFRLDFQLSLSVRVCADVFLRGLASPTGPWASPTGRPPSYSCSSTSSQRS